MPKSHPSPMVALMVTEYMIDGYQEAADEVEMLLGGNRVPRGKAEQAVLAWLDSDLDEHLSDIIGHHLLEMKDIEAVGTQMFGEPDPLTNKEINPLSINEAIVLLLKAEVVNALYNEQFVYYALREMGY